MNAPISKHDENSAVGFDLWRAPVVDQFDARACPDGIYRNRWGARFCSVEGCGLVSDWCAGGEELCLFHAAAGMAQAEMTEVLHRYRPLVIAAKQYERLHDEADKVRDGVEIKGERCQEDAFNIFVELVADSGFYRVPRKPTPDDPSTFTEVPLPLARWQLEKGQRFVHPIEYFKTVALGHVEYLSAMRAEKASKAAVTSKNRRIAQALRKKISALGDTGSRHKPSLPPSPPSIDYDDDLVF